MARSNITLSNRLIVPADLVTNRDLRAFHYKWKERKYSLKENEFGEVLHDEYDEPIRQKQDVEESFLTYRELFGKDGTSYISFPRGNLEKLEPFLRQGYQDLRPVVPLEVQLEMSESTLEDHRWADQERCIHEYLKRGYGIIEGDTGSGKTVMGVGVIAMLGMTTLILSSLTDGTDQWIEELEEHTNIRELEEITGRKLVGPFKANRKKNFFPITVGTVQSFIKTRGKKWLRQHRNDFGLLVIDEVQDFGAEQFSKVVQALNPLATLGLTATVDRKDNRHHLIFDMVGPVVAKGKAKQMPPTVHFIETGSQCPTWQYKKNFPRHYQWKVIMDHLIQDDDRYRIIQEYLRKDADAGRVIACVAPQRTAVAKKLHLLLSQDGYDVRYVDGKVKKPVRKLIYKEVREGKVQILFAGKVLNKLVNLPRVDCLHYVTPASSKGETKQAYGRARRWLAGKKKPIIRDYVDEGGGQLSGAYNNRMRLCRSHGWDVKVVPVGTEQAGRVGVWKNYAKRKK